MKFIDGPPPAAQRPGRYAYERIATILQESPGQWADIGEGPTNLMAAYASRFRGRSGTRYSFVSRSTGHGTGISKLYGRFNGDTPPE